MYTLFCMDAREPVGVSAPELLFRWQVSEVSSSLRQSACRLWVVDSDEKMIYDSGKIETDEPQLAVERRFFESSKAYFFHVECWNERGESMGQSAPSRFVTGVFEDKFPADFILADVPEWDLFSDTVLYRCEFELPQACLLGIVHAASIGEHELYINGRKIGPRVMSPSRSKIQKDSPRMSDAHENELTRVRSVSYDATSALCIGKNTLCCWTDAGWARSSRIEPALAVFGTFKTADGTQTVQTRAADWSCARMGVRHIHGFKWGDFGGEEIHTRTVGSQIHIDGLTWKPVRKAVCDSIVSADMQCGDQILKRLAPADIRRIDGENAFIIDMGEPFSGWLSFTIPEGTAGQKVTLSAADKASEEISFNQQSEFILDSLPAPCCNRFNFMCGRYFCIRGTECEPQNVEGLVIGTSMKSEMEFHSSNAMLDEIVQTDIRTYTANTINGVTCDCPHRERLGYGETGISTTWGIGLHAFDSRQFYNQFFENWADRQTESGYLPHVAPNFNGGGGTAWSSCLLITLHEYLRYFPNHSLVVKFYSAINDWVNYLLNHTEAGLFTRNIDDKKGFAFLGDWACSEGDDWGFTPNALFFNNCVALYDLKLGMDFAKAFGNQGDLNLYTAGYRCMKKAIHEKYYDREKKQYMNGEQRYQAVALCAGLPPEKDLPDVVETFRRSLDKKRYLDGGSAGLPFIFRAALEYLTDPQLMYEILNRAEFPGYGYFIANHCQTWPEMWNISEIYGGSRVHTCYTGVTGYIVRGIAGILPDDRFGIRKLRIKPFFPSDMDHLRIRLNYGFGNIRLEWERAKGGEIDCTLEVPFNSEAHFALYDGSRFSDTKAQSRNFPAGIHRFTIIQFR